MSQVINFINPFTQGTLQEQSAGFSENGAIVFPYKNGAYRLVEDDNYTQNFAEPSGVVLLLFSASHFLLRRRRPTR